MTFTFPRLSAGIYEVQKNSNTVGFIRKASASASKWIVADVVDTPQHVSKTLKDAKDACINLIIFDTQEQKIDKVSESLYNDPVEVHKYSSGLLEGSLNTYRQIPGTNEFEEVSPSKFGFAEPTLDPIAF